MYTNDLEVTKWHRKSYWHLKGFKAIFKQILHAFGVDMWFGVGMCEYV